MKNNLQSFFLLILCALIIVGAACDVAAQTGADKILIAGKTPLKQSEVDKLIEFYEWAFETRFTARERERYRAFVVEGFRQNQATARQNTDGLVGSLAKVLARDAAQQAKMRASFNQGFVKDLRAADDEGSQMLLAIYERGQNAGGGETSEENSNEQPKPARGGGAGSSNLVGS